MNQNVGFGNVKAHGSNVGYDKYSRTGVASGGLEPDKSLGASSGRHRAIDFNRGEIVEFEDLNDEIVVEREGREGENFVAR